MTISYIWIIIEKVINMILFHEGKSILNNILNKLNKYNDNLNLSFGWLHQLSIDTVNIHIWNELGRTLSRSKLIVHSYPTTTIETKINKFACQQNIQKRKAYI